jgi:hypothetical protein
METKHKKKKFAIWPCAMTICLLPCFSGCSALIANSGIKIDHLQTRQQVQAVFGEPTENGVIDAGFYEVYHTRRKISNPMHMYDVAFVTYWGLTEPVYFIGELGSLARTVVMGRDVRFEYDFEEKVQPTPLFAKLENLH